MKRIFRFVILLFFVLVPAGVFANDLGIARLSVIEGDVQVLIEDTTDWAPAAINLPLNEHDRLWVADDSRAELQIEGGVYVRADGSTALDILTVSRDSAQFYLDQGHVYINNRRGGIGTVQIDTPTASFRSYDNSIMMVDVTEDGVNAISVLKGIVYAESRAGATRVSAGSTLTIRGDSDAEISPVAAPDAWEEWNVERDRQVSAWSESSRYLPDELHEYSSDFDQNGSWDYVSDYGYVWFPSVTVQAWAPYSYGHWIWIRGSYVWIDDYPWGWAPTHYGRWVFVGSRGWCWVPPAAGAVYWAPGYVGWVVTPTYVAWVPLAPGETYYGYGYYGPGSVNITTVNVNSGVVNRTYRNAQVRNSVVVVARDTFGTGRRVPVTVRENPFLRSKRESRAQVTIVPPRVRPERPIVIPRQEFREHGVVQEHERTRPAPVPAPAPGIRQHSPERANRVAPSYPGTVAKPPERVMQNRPEIIKNERPLIRQREASVFKQRQPDNLPVTRLHEPRVISRPATPTNGQRPSPERNVRQQKNQEERRGR